MTTCLYNVDCVVLQCCTNALQSPISSGPAVARHLSQDRWGMAASDSEISGQLLVKTINIGEHSNAISPVNGNNVDHQL